jgi:hypothetical protein
MSDTKPKIIANFAHAVIAPQAEIGELAVATNKFNYTGTGVKVLGSAVFGIITGTTRSMFMAKGDTPTSPWANLIGTGADVTPSGSITSGSSAGDVKPRAVAGQVGSTDFSIIPVADLANIGHHINYNEYSGKRYGAIVIADRGAGVYELVVAQGDAPTDTWVGITTTVSPTGTAIPVAPVKPVSYNTIAVAIPVNVVTRAELDDIAAPVNAGDGTVSGKQARSLVYTDEGELRVATGSAANSTWVKALGTDTNDAITPA